MENVNVQIEIKQVKDKIIDLDNAILDVAREKVKRKCDNKTIAAKVIVDTIYGGLFVYLSIPFIFFDKLLPAIGMLGTLELADFTFRGISKKIEESKLKKCDDLAELRSVAAKLAKKDPELARKIVDKEEHERILTELNKKIAEEDDSIKSKETVFTPINPIVQGNLSGHKGLALERTREKNTNKRKL